MRRGLACLLALSLLGSCGDDDDDPPGSDGGGGSDSGGGGSDSGGGQSDAPAGGWQTLIQSSWSIPAGAEGYWCERKTLTEDVWIIAFRPIIPAASPSKP